MYMNMGKNIYYEVWKNEPELLEAKFVDFQSFAINTLHTSPNAYKL